MNLLMNFIFIIYFCDNYYNLEMIVDNFKNIINCSIRYKFTIEKKKNNDLNIFRIFEEICILIYFGITK